MNFLAKPELSPSNNATDCAVIFCADKKLSASAQLLDTALNGALTSLLTLGEFKGKTVESQWVTSNANVAAKRILLISTGKPEGKLENNDFIQLCKTAATALVQSAAKDATLYFDTLLEDNNIPIVWALPQLAKIFTTSTYQYTLTKNNQPAIPLTKVTYAAPSRQDAKLAKPLLKKGTAIGEGVNLACELGNLPPNICTPTYLAKLADTLASQCAALSCKSLSEKQMEKLGMGAFLSVAKGSEQEGKMIVMEYRGAGKEQPLKDCVVLVGKGITFDTGGISLKPGLQMDEMKFDMCGAASVFGTLNALMQMDAPVNVVCVVAAAENMPNGNASKPGDVVTSMSGQTIEILNTDAEGRLVLCDALTYVERYKPKAVIDIATLTGACVIALGNHASGLFSNNQALADELLSSGESTQDRAWQMPLWDEYQKSLDSNFADMANIGGREGGSITAACFLSRYTKKYHWAHLDIAGTAWVSGAKKGATGRPVSLLTDYILNTEK